MAVGVAALRGSCRFGHPLDLRKNGSVQSGAASVCGIRKVADSAAIGLSVRRVKVGRSTGISLDLPDIALAD